MVDFVEEVEEQLRAERYASLFRRFLPWFLVALAATIIGWLGAWAWQNWESRQIGAASIAYEKAVGFLSQGDLPDAEKTLAPLTQGAPGGYKTLALMLQANIRAAQDKPADAAAMLDQAAKAAPNAVLHDLAALRAAQVLMDATPYPQIETRLKALIGVNKPYDSAARELLALAKLQAGDLKGARGEFNALSLNLKASPSVRNRAATAIGLIDGGGGEMVGKVVAAAVASPKTVMQMPSAPAPAEGSDQ